MSDDFADDLAGQQASDLFSSFVDKEMQTVDIFLTSKATRTAIAIEEYVHTRLIQGADREVIRADLLRDLEEGGRIFGEFRNSIRATSNGIINRLRDNAVFSTAGVEQKYRWVAVLVNTCPDCLDRHGKVKAWSEWEADGLPRTGQTVCKENCRCVLLPSATTALEPIMRGNN
jgi:hypothetical protein